MTKAGPEAYARGVRRTERQAVETTDDGEAGQRRVQELERNAAADTVHRSRAVVHVGDPDLAVLATEGWLNSPIVSTVTRSRASNQDGVPPIHSLYSECP